MKRKSAQIGFTLIESLTASVILAFAIIGITVPMMAGIKSEKQDGVTTAANYLAQEMMDEILAHEFNDQTANGKLGPESSEKNRSSYDSINDYDGLSEPKGQIKNLSGETLTQPAVALLTRNVSVTYVYVSGQDSSKPATFARVVVELKDSGQPVLKLTRLIYDNSDTVTGG